MTIEIVSADAVSDDALLVVINESFERSPKSNDWFRWKHREGPWGRSIGTAAVRDGEVVGVRLFVPWAATTPDDREVPVLRAMDGAVLSSARRQGVFSKLVRRQLQEIEAGSITAAFVYSTSVPASREAYRKLGWSIFDVKGTVKIPLPRVLTRLEYHHWPNFPPHELPPSSRCRTAWDGESLAWRTDPRSGHEYHTFSLSQANRPNGVIARRARVGKISLAVVTHLWAVDPRDERELIGALPRALRCAAVWCIDEAPAQQGLRRTRGTSSVSLWASSRVDWMRYVDRDSWSFSFGDLEGVM